MTVTISRRDFDAAIFDLDGVLTDTAGVHAVAWKSVFDTFLQRWARERGLAFQAFDIETDTATMSMGDRATMVFEAFSPPEA